MAGRIASGSPEMRVVYPLDGSLSPDVSRFALYSLVQLAYYFGWEVLFRGVLLFGTKDRWGFWGANVLQTALSVVAHFGRPLEETFSAFPAGLLFGAVAVRVGSVWPLVLLHWVVGMSMNAFIVFGRGGG
jgi:membrane protease YdiL (CAAX protease family)